MRGYHGSPHSKKNVPWHHGLNFEGMKLTAGSGSRWRPAPRRRSSEPHTFGANQIHSPSPPMNSQREIERSENTRCVRQIEECELCNPRRPRAVRRAVRRRTVATVAHLREPPLKEIRDPWHMERTGSWSSVLAMEHRADTPTSASSN